MRNENERTAQASKKPTTHQPPHVVLTGVSKRYGGVTALDSVDFACSRGSIHAVLGENGAGKSTLIKIMSGVVQPDEGQMSVAGTPVVFPNPASANAAGVVCIFQELSLMQDLTVADNISIADLPRRFGLIDAKAQRLRAEEVLASIGCEDVNPLSRIRDLPLSRRQMVEIGKALTKDPTVLILDEATSALTAADVEKVFAILHRLRDQGLSILTISHRMHEIEAVADMCSVFRNGRHIETFAEGSRTNTEIVQMMIGREITAHFPPKHERPQTEPVLETRGLNWEGRLTDINLTVRRGEIVGLGGLDGQGQKELLLGLAGVLKSVSGDVLINGKKTSISSPEAAKAKGAEIALIPEDRKTEGLMLTMSIADNLTAASMDRYSRFQLLDAKALADAVQSGIERMRIKIGSPDDPVSTLSGGNQQKVVIAKWLLTDPKIILLNDPTRGIDVGTKQEIYRLLRALADEGASILFYSTDYEELIGCCDRVDVMYDGRIVRELIGEDINEHEIIASALNIEGATSEKRDGGGGGMMKRNALTDLRIRASQNVGLLTAIVLFAVFYIFYNLNHPRGFSTAVLIQNSNEVYALAMVAMAQTLPVLLGGLDLSVGAVMTLVNTLASHVLNGSPFEMFLGFLLCVAAGAACGFVNGCVVVYGRLQPIIATLATGAIYMGIALFLRPSPGGDVDGDLSWALTNDLYEIAATYGFAENGEAAWFKPIAGLPTPLLLLILTAVVIWMPFRRSVIGRTVYAIGSGEGAAYMSGLNIDRAKIAAFTLGGLFAGLGGLYLALQTSSGNADIPQAGAYTLNSIAAVVVGGTSLLGGVGTAVGSIFGALVLRTISFNFRIFEIDPLMQPLFEGVVLLAAVSLGALRVLKVKNTLELFR